jgi:hypothetical protein
VCGWPGKTALIDKSNRNQERPCRCPNNRQLCNSPSSVVFGSETCIEWIIALPLCQRLCSSLSCGCQPQTVFPKSCQEHRSACSDFRRVSNKLALLHGLVRAKLARAQNSHNREIYPLNFRQAVCEKSSPARSQACCLPSPTLMSSTFNPRTPFWLCYTALW